MSFLLTALQPSLPNLFRRALALGLTISLDPNFEPSGDWRGLVSVARMTAEVSSISMGMIS
jgi:hypothetical protein